MLEVGGTLTFDFAGSHAWKAEVPPSLSGGDFKHKSGRVDAGLTQLYEALNKFCGVCCKMVVMSRHNCLIIMSQEG